MAEHYSVNRATVERGEYPDTHEETVRYQERDDGWYVTTPEDRDFWLFAQKSARERDVTQLIRKKWCNRYGDPDDWEDHS